MKILHVVHSLDPGGMENGVVNISHGLAARGITCAVACLANRGVFGDRLPQGSAVFAFGKSDGFSLATAFHLARVIGTWQPDLVHSHNLGALIYSALATGGGRRPALVHGEHSHLSGRDLTTRRLVQRRWLYRCCRAVHTVAEAMREELVAHELTARRLIAIPNGVDCARFQTGDRGAARRALGLPATAVLLGIVGRFAPSKHHALLVDAFELLAAREPCVHLMIAGSGGSAERAVLAQVEKSPHRARIHVLGFLAEPSLCYHALDLLVVPSSNEGLSNAVLEAMATGLPALVRSGCGHEQIIAHGRDGWIFPMLSATDLATGLAELLEQPSRFVDFGLNARKKVAAHFSLPQMIDRYEDLYRACALR